MVANEDQKVFRMAQHAENRPAGSDQVKSLATALQIFANVSEQEEVSVSVLSRRLGLPKSQVSRVLSTFRNAGFVNQNPENRRYRVGLRAYAIGCRYLDSNRMALEAYPVLRSAADRTGYSSAVSVLDDIRPLYLMGVEGSISVEFGSQVGVYFPFHATAPGRVLAAFCSPDVRRRMLLDGPFERFTPRTIIDPAELRRELKRVVACGFAHSKGDRRPGIGSFAVPIFGRDPTFVGALSLAFPLGRVSGDQGADLVTVLHDLARSLSHRLSAASYPFGLREPVIGKNGRWAGAPQ